MKPSIISAFARFRLASSRPLLRKTASSRFASADVSVLALRKRILNSTCMKGAASGVAVVGSGTFLTLKSSHEELSAPSEAESPPLPPPPTSSIQVYQLTFGTVCGICAGVFIKKGTKILAFVVGGVFILLQYLSSLSLIHVDWIHVENRFQDSFYKTNADGTKSAPTVYDVWKGLVDFLTADFQQRASFIVGMALGLRVG